MGDNMVSVIVTLVVFALMAFLIFKSRQNRPSTRLDRTHSKATGSLGSTPSGQGAKAAMAEINDHLEQLKAHSKAQEGTPHAPQTHVVTILEAVQSLLIDLDQRINVFEREAEAFKKSHVGMENP